MIPILCSGSGYLSLSYALTLVTYALLLADNLDGRRGLQQLNTLAYTTGKIGVY